MQDAREVYRRKRRSNRTVLAGLALMTTALLLSTIDRLPAALSTAGAVVGFVLLAYGVHVGWLVFYDSEPDGPPS